MNLSGGPTRTWRRGRKGRIYFTAPHFSHISENDLVKFPFCLFPSFIRRSHGMIDSNFITWFVSFSIYWVIFSPLIAWLGNFVNFLSCIVIFFFAVNVSCFSRFQVLMYEALKSRRLCREIWENYTSWKCEDCWSRRAQSPSMFSWRIYNWNCGGRRRRWSGACREERELTWPWSRRGA